ncbi:DUF6807 family protein, partial [Pedobacter sp. JCM 36344]|uniref:DUF6807 family protein n=1 Tax=Pedobacter sp. JCM 36344 TaxID=3374280 RepID=UPI003979562F
MKLFLTLCLIAGVLLNASAQLSENIKITNDNYLRVNSIVYFRLKPKNGSENIYLLDKNKQKHPVQFLKDGFACTIISLRPREVKYLKAIEESTAGTKSEISLTETEAKFIIKGKQVISLQNGKKDLPSGVDSVFRRGGYIFPIFSPSGLSVADDYPLIHKHHHGIWAAWTKTEFEGRHPDFWNMGDKTGTV